MLTVAKITIGSAAGYADYLEGRSEATSLGDYYLKDGDRVEVPGRWVSGATAIGMDPAGAVTGGQLRALMAVRRPDTGEPLRRAGATGQVAALDATFSAPKSVSATWAVAERGLRAEIEQAHETAIDRTLTHSVQAVAMIRVRTNGRVNHDVGRDVIASSWRHTTARAVAGQVPDPQLHSHVLLHGALRADGKVLAIDSRAWFQHRRELGAAYRTELARGLHELGFQVIRGTGRAGRYFEIAGVPQELIDRWSSRHRQVRHAIEAQLRDQEHELESIARTGGQAGERAAESLRRLREQQQLTPRQDRRAAISTRAGKQQLSTHRELDQTWHTTAREHGLTPHQIDSARQHPTPQLEPSDDLDQRLTEFEARFTDRDARAVALEASAGLSIADAIAPLEEMRQDRTLLTLSDQTLTTDRHRAREERTRQAARQLAVAGSEPVDPRRVSAEIQRLNQRLVNADGSGCLTAEQEAAIRLSCGERRMSVIEGQAGTGKSTVLIATARAHQAHGQRIIVTSTAALAAHRLADELADHGVDCRAHSTAALHAAVTTGREQLNARTTVIHDEAALASTREQRNLFSAVQQTGARLIEVGDPAQSQPVGAGGMWTDIHRAATDHHAHQSLTHNVRARDRQDRLDQRLFRDGDHEAALRGYNARGRIQIAATATDAEHGALAAGHEDRASGRNSLVIAQTSNEHLDELNARAQALRRRDGEVTGPGLAVIGRPYDLHAGDRIQIRRTIVDPRGETRLHNGMTGDVRSVTRGGDALALSLDSGQTVGLTRAQVAKADVRLAYVQHPFPAQGVTSDTTHLIHTDQATREGSYVGLTRARERTTIHTPELVQEPFPSDLTRREATLSELADRMGRSEPEMPSLHVPIAHEHTIADDIDSATARGSIRAEARMPGDHLTRALGPRPGPDDALRDTWDSTAEAITNYRTRHDIPDQERSPLGPQPPAGEFEQRVEYRRATSTIDHTARALGHHPPDRAQTAERQRVIDTDGYEP